MGDIGYRHEPEQRRYVAEADGQRIGLVDYRSDGAVAEVTHTEVDPARQGQGIADGLTRYVVEDLRSAGLRIRPICPYTRAWLGRHPEFADIVAS